MRRMLLLLRHGQAVHQIKSIDFNRTLTLLGQQTIRQLGQEMAVKGLLPDGVISSPAIRAKETTETLLQPLDYQGEINWDKRIYNAAPETLLKVINQHGGFAQRLLVVGHNPGISTLAHYLTGQWTSMAPGDLVAIEFHELEWAAVAGDTGVLITLDL